MENKGKILAIGFVTIGLVAFGVMNEKANWEDHTVHCATIGNELDSLNKWEGIQVFDFKPEPRNTDVYYSISTKYRRTTTKYALHNTQDLNQIIPNYPDQWITNYVSVEVIVNDEGLEKKAMGKSKHLTKEQSDLLKSVDYFSDVHINVKYLAKNSITRKDDAKEMKVSLTIVPKVQAEYSEGYEAMIAYIKKEGKNHVNYRSFVNSGVVIDFDVNEKGAIENVILSESCGDAKTDIFLLNVIATMPKWKPAKNLKGENVTQSFVFGTYGAGC